MRCTLGWLEPIASNEQRVIWAYKSNFPSIFFFSFSPAATLREAEQKNCTVVMEIQIRTKMKSTQETT